MIFLIASIIIIVIFARGAKKSGQNWVKWSLLGLITFWVPFLIPMSLIYFFIGNPPGKIEVAILVVCGFISLMLAGILCAKMFRKLKDSGVRE